MLLRKLTKNKEVRLYSLSIEYEGLTSTEPHYHERTHEYLIALKGWAMIEVGGKQHKLKEEEVMYLQPGEVHRLTGQGSSDFCMLIIKYPFIPGDKIISGYEKFRRLPDGFEIMPF